MSDRDDILEFARFLTEERAPSLSIQSRMLQVVHTRLHPRRFVIVTKLFLFHAFGSFMTLLFCPQFGVSVTGVDLLMPSLMSIHPALCFFVCGLLWMLVGQILGYVLLSIDEHRVMGNSEVGVGFGVVGLTLIFFGCLGKLQPDGWLTAWSLGALILVTLFQLKLWRERRRCLSFITAEGHGN